MESNTIFNDFSLEISKAINAGYLTLSNFIKKKYNGDPTLDYTVSEKIIKISPSVFYEKLGGKNSLEYISNFSKSLATKYCLAIEIAFTAIFDENSFKLIQVIPGEVGNCNECDLDEGDLLKNSYLEADNSKAKVVLGHTHPVFSEDGFTVDSDRVYGAIPSCIPYHNASDVRSYFKNNTELAEEIIKRKIIKSFRADYVELYTRAQLNPLISNYCIIISPYLEQLGIFEVNPEGKIVYHPWIVSE